jgi:integrase
MASFAQKVFNDIRKAGRMRELSEAEINTLLHNYFKQTLADDERSRVMEDEPLPKEVQSEEIMGYDYVEDCMKEDLASCNYENASKIVGRMLQGNGIELDPQSYSYRKLCREILKVNVNIFQALKKREIGDYSHEGQHIAIPAVIPPVAEITPSAPVQASVGESITLSSLIEEYIAENDRTGNWTAKTKKDLQASSQLLMEVIGDVPVKSITRRTTSEYKKTLTQLPSNMHKKRAYRDKTIRQILQMDIPQADLWSTTTLNKLIDRASMLFKWAVRNGYMESNPAEGMMLKKSKRDDEERQVFSSDDLQRLFHSREFLTDRHLHSYCFWTPLLGLFTGCRLEEICQLDLDDIMERRGVWGIDINENGDKRVKTKAGIRFVPLHPFLVNDLRFLQYVEHLRSKGQTRLFPELKKCRDGYSHSVSHWFARYRKRCGVTDEGKVFHSFRHTFIDTLKQNPQVTDSHMIAELVGHEVGSITTGRYGKRYQPQVLFDHVIKKLNYDIDLRHLKESRYVRK